MDTREAQIRKSFQTFARDRDYINKSMVIQCIRCAGIVVPDNFVQQEEISEQVNFEEFLKLVNNASTSEISRESIESSFKFFDPLETGYIDLLVLKQILEAGSNPLTPQEIEEIFDIIKPNEEGRVCYSLFLQKFYESLK